MMLLRDLTNARFVCKSWRDSADICLGNPHTLKGDIRKSLGLEANEFGPIDRGTKLDREKQNKDKSTCTTQSIVRHMECLTCESIRYREWITSRHSDGLDQPTGEVANLYLNIHEGRRAPIQGAAKCPKARFWPDMSQFIKNLLLDRILGCSVRWREGRRDLTIEENVYGMFRSPNRGLRR